MRLQLDTLKGGILFHIQEWIKTLGRLLEQTAWERLDKITNLVDDYSSRAKPIRHSSEIEKALTLISSIWGMSLEVSFKFDFAPSKFILNSIKILNEELFHHYLLILG